MMLVDEGNVCDCFQGKNGVLLLHYERAIKWLNWGIHEIHVRLGFTMFVCMGVDLG